ncbi:MAG: hypothetical protein Q9181_004722, partial [Wetmoreana brouardii]
ISPEDFQKPSAESIEDNINAKYANRVIQKIGLCICLYDILTASDGLIGHGTGIVNVNVEFRLVVFRPFKGEIVAGRISTASQDGMRIALDFFDDIFVPSTLLFPDSTFNDQEQCWVWSNEGQEYFYDKTDWVRFRVEQEHWTDLSPIAPSERESAATTERKSFNDASRPWTGTVVVINVLGPNEIQILKAATSNAPRSASRFPVFDDGDVEIRLSPSPEDRLVLHSSILRLHSDFFRASLSERWSASEGTASDPTRWQYELAFEGSMGAFLRKQTSVPLGDSTENSAGRLFQQQPASRSRFEDLPEEENLDGLSVSEGSTDGNVRGNPAAVESHRLFFSIIYHHALDLKVSGAIVDALRQVANLVTVGGLYGGLQPLTAPVEAFICRHMGIYRHHLVAQAPVFLHIASTLKISWLYKDIVCLAAGDRTRDHYQVVRTFQPDMASVILQKRQILWILMRRIDSKLLAIGASPEDSEVHRKAAADFHEQVEWSIGTAVLGPWYQYATTYDKTLFDRRSTAVRVWSHSISTRACHLVPDEAKEYNKFWDKLRGEALSIIKPLYKGYLSPLSDIDGQSPRIRDRRHHHSFTCIKVSDNDLPWKNKQPVPGCSL